MSYRGITDFFFSSLLLSTLSCQLAYAKKGLPLHTIKLPPGFEIKSYGLLIMDVIGWEMTFLRMS
ncbi:MAG: hypothetical protein D8M57_17500 [Candidatus Scalindua sp. AMX11]|nr:MAG: hypothetical protein DWQ00_16265 [Candidatus Scalindua sp.]NOG84307.1 hypothetical protein [Planctomycetota bacterium]RZV66420.1 MAG: hypothetical protein EX341_17505 [Candidatus Scalindua sp. SCAELEC01]TDE63589.1 MAG: hypothetical protein D8M57_17500 [Candidatus Scalindua sp. AMX11]